MQDSTTSNALRNDAPTQRTDIASILRNYSTEEAAELLKIRPQTLRAALCREGHYAGVVPRKLPSRFLTWPADQIEALLAGGRK